MLQNLSNDINEHVVKQTISDQIKEKVNVHLNKVHELLLPGTHAIYECEESPVVKRFYSSEHESAMRKLTEFHFKSNLRITEGHSENLQVIK